MPAPCSWRASYRLPSWARTATETASGRSVRTTQRVFRRYVGVPVKWVLCRYRLQNAALEIEMDQEVDFADGLRRTAASVAADGPAPMIGRRMPTSMSRGHVWRSVGMMSSGRLAFSKTTSQFR